MNATMRDLLASIEPFDQRKALQTLSHATRLRNRRSESPARLSFVVHLDAR